MKGSKGNGDESADHQRELIDAALRQADSVRQRAQATAAAPASDSALAELSSDSVTGYKIVREIHRGGQGVVYLALQQSTGRKVAMKVMKEGPFAGAADRARFDREVQILGQLDHPNIVTIHDSGSAAGHHFFVMDYVPGQPLDVYMAGAQRSIDETLKLFGKICDAVNAAHLRGVIHRDLKPGNIRVDTAGDPRVLDFGLAKVATPLSPPLEGGDGGGVAAMTLTGQFVGSLPWASPEQAEGAPSKIDLRTDVYSLGVILYHMLTGKLPYDVTGNVRDALDAIMTAEPARPRSLRRQVNDEVETIVLKCLHKDRDRRYQTAGELGRDVQHYLAGEPIEAKRDSGWYVLKKTLRRYRVPTAVAAGFVVLITASTVALGLLYREADDQRRIAEAAEREQSRAREEAEEARDQTQIVADFQSSMLAGTDAEGMGLAIVDGFEDRIRAVLAERIEDQGELDRVMHEWRQQTLKAGPTNVALEVLDEFVLAKAAETIEKDFVDQPLVEAALRQTVSVTYRDLGMYPQAVPQQKRVLGLRRGLLGDDHPDTLTSINHMGRLLQSMGKFDKAMPYFREALESRRRVPGDEHPDTLSSIDNMGGLLYSMGKLEEAEPYFREALEGYRRVLGDDHQNTLRLINNMGALLQSQGKLAETERYKREALEGARRVLGDDHPGTLASISNMGFLLKSMGKFVDAEPLFREALEGRRRVLGDDHPHTLQSINNMGALLESMGKLDEAMPYAREALEGRRRVLGDAHPSTHSSINNMGGLLTSMGKLAEAEPYYREALEGSRRALGDDHPGTLIPIHNMGCLLRDLGRLEEADALGAEAVRGAKAKLAPSHLFRLATLAQHGRTLCAMQRFTEAESELLEAYEGSVETRGEEDERTIKTIKSLIDLYDAWGEAEPDAGYDEKAAEWRAKLPMPQPLEVPSEP